MLRTKYIADVHKEYRDVVQALNLVADALRSIDGDEMYVCNTDQIRLLRKMGTQVIELEAAAKALKLYVRDIAIRLGLLP